MPTLRPRAFADMPIKGKLMAIIMAVTTAALFISGLALMAADSMLFREHLERDLTVLAAITADNSTAALSFNDPQSAVETLTALRTRVHVVAACINRPDGQMFAQYSRSGTAPACPPLAGANGIWFTARDVTVSRVMVLATRPIGTLVLLYDLGEIGERRRLYGASVAGILLASSFLAMLLSSKLRKVIATPISELALTAAAVSETQD